MLSVIISKHPVTNVGTKKALQLSKCRKFFESNNANSLHDTIFQWSAFTGKLQQVSFHGSRSSTPH